MRPMLAALSLALALVCAFSVSAVSPQTAEARKRCGTVHQGNIKVKVIVRRGRIPCSTARRIVSRNFLYNGPFVGGWFCFTAHRNPGGPPLRRVGSCAPNGRDPDTARRSIVIVAA